MIVMKNGSVDSEFDKTVPEAVKKTASIFGSSMTLIATAFSSAIIALSYTCT